MSGAWFSCEARESNTNIACWFPSPRLQSLDKIATKYFPTQDMLTPWHLEIRRIFGVRLGKWSRTKNMISNWHWWKYDRISFDETSARPLYLSQVLALSQNDLMRRLKNPEETLERALESIRDLLDLWKMGAAFDTEFGCENFYRVASANF